MGGSKSGRWEGGAYEVSPGGAQGPVLCAILASGGRWVRLKWLDVTRRTRGRKLEHLPTCS